MEKFARTALTALVLGLALVVGAAAEGTIENLPQSKGAAVNAAAGEGTPVPTPTPIDGGMSGTWDAESWADAQTEEDPWLADPSYGAERTFTDENGLFPSGQALYDYWQSEGWPETVGDVWSADGTMDNLIVAVVDGDQAVIDGIRARMADPDCLTFTACKYSHAQLEQTMSEIETAVKENKLKCILSVGMGVRDNDFTVNGQPCVHVTISTLQPDGEEWAEKLAAQYGGLVELEVGDITLSVSMGDTLGGNNMPIPGGGREDGALSGLSWVLWAFPVVVLAGLCLLGLALNRRAVLRTADGRSVTAGGKVGRAQAEAMVRSTALRPDRDNWDAIQKKL